MVMTLVAVVCWLGFYLWYFLAYNHLVAVGKSVTQAWSQVDVELQRRHDLIGNLVVVVKAYARHEGETLLQTTQARAAATTAGAPAAGSGPRNLDVATANQSGHADAVMITQLLAIVEKYPTLKADTQFTTLQQALIDTENRIALRRNAYNECVSRYEISRTSFPALLVAWAGYFGAQSFFDAQDETAQAVRVNLQ